MKDIDQKEAGLLRIELPRTINSQGLATTRLLSIYLLLTGLVFAGVFFLLVNMSLLSPIRQLRDEARNLGRQGNFSGRIPAKGVDEISNLANSFNNLLEALEARAEELKVASDLGQRLKQYQAALDICHKFSGKLNQQELLEKAVELIQERFKLTFVGVYLTKEASGSVKLMAESGETGKQMLASAFKIPLTSLQPIISAITSRKSNYQPNANSVTLGPIFEYLPTILSTLDIPLIIEHQVTGVLSLYSNIPNNFNDRDIEMFEIIANSLSAALENAQTFQEVQNNFEKIQKLHQQYLGEAWSEKAKVSGGLSYTYESEQTTAAPDGGKKLDLPIELRDQMIGRLVLEVDRTSLSPEEVDLVKTIATDTAIALENTRLLEDAQRRAEREQFLAELSNKVRATTDVDSILRTAILELGLSLKASEGIIRLGSDDDDRT